MCHDLSIIQSIEFLEQKNSLQKLVRQTVYIRFDLVFELQGILYFSNSFDKLTFCRTMTSLNCYMFHSVEIFVNEILTQYVKLLRVLYLFTIVRELSVLFQYAIKLYKKVLMQCNRFHSFVDKQCSIFRVHDLIKCYFISSGQANQLPVCIKIQGSHFEFL